MTHTEFLTGMSKESVFCVMCCGAFALVAILALVVCTTSAATYADHVATYYPENLLSYPLQDTGDGLVINESTGKVSLYNILGNPGFETQGDPFSWTLSVGNGVLTNETAIVHSGTYAMNVTSGGAGTTLISQLVTVVPNVTYNFSFWYRGGGVKYPRIAVYDLTHSSYNIALQNLPSNATSFVFNSTIIKTNAGQTQMRVYLEGPSSLGVSYFDDASLVSERIYATLPGSGIAYEQPGPVWNASATDNKSMNFSFSNTYVQIGNTAFNSTWNGDVGTALGWGMIHNASLWNDPTYRYIWHMKASNNDTWYNVFGISGNESSGSGGIANSLSWRFRQGGASNNKNYTFVTPPTGQWLCMAMTWNTSSERMRGYLFIPGTLDFTEVFNSTIEDSQSWGLHPATSSDTMLFAGGPTAQQWAGSGTQFHLWNGIDLSSTEIQDIMEYGTDTEPAPVASFTANTTAGVAPLAVAFTDTSTNTSIDWDWYIDDVKFSDLQNPEYTFNTSGVYDVSLYAANGASGDWENKTGYITVNATIPSTALQCENVTGNLTPILSQVSDTTLGYSLSLADNLTAISFDGLFELAFDNTTDSIVFSNLQPSTWHRFKIYNETEWGMLNCTTNTTPVTLTPLPVMPSTDSMGGVNFAAYWWTLPVLGAVVLLFKRF